MAENLETSIEENAFALISPKIIQINCLLGVHDWINSKCRAPIKSSLSSLWTAAGVSKLIRGPHKISKLWGAKCL